MQAGAWQRVHERILRRLRGSEFFGDINASEMRIRHEQRADINQAFFRSPARSSVGDMLDRFVWRTYTMAIEVYSLHLHYY